MNIGYAWGWDLGGRKRQKEKEIESKSEQEVAGTAWKRGLKLPRPVVG